MSDERQQRYAGEKKNVHQSAGAQQMPTIQKPPEKRAAEGRDPGGRAAMLAEYPADSTNAA